MPNITITLSQEAADWLETVRLNDKVHSADPNNPENVIVSPRHASVSAWIVKIVEDSLAPHIARMPVPPDVEQMQRTLEAQQEAIRQRMKVVQVK